MIFSKLVNDLWPQIGIQLVTGIAMVLLAMVIVMYGAGGATTAAPAIAEVMSGTNHIHCMVKLTTVYTLQITF